MALSEEQIRLGEDRKLIFQNFCNEVPKEQIAVSFSRSVEEIERDILFVARKINEYRHRRCLRPAGLPASWRDHGDVAKAELGMLPPISCQNERDIMLNRESMLWTLDFIGPETLASELLIPTLTVHKVDPERPVSDLREAAHAMRTTITETA